MYILSEIIGVISEVIIIFLFIQGVFSKKALSPLAFIFSFFFYGAGLLSLSFIISAAILRIIFCGVGIVLLVLFLYHSNLVQAVFIGIVFCAVYMMIDVFVMLLASLFSIDSGVIMSHSVTRSIYIVTTHILLLVAVLIILCFVRNKSNAVTFPFVLILSPGYVISITLGLSFCRYLQNSAEDLPLPFLFASLALLYMNIVIVFYAQQAKISADKQRETELAEHHYQMQELYYTQLQSEQDEARALFHDMSKRMKAMKALVRENSTKEANLLLEETQSLYENLGTVVDVGNPIISAILNEYKEKAVKESISFTFSVSVPPQLNLSAVDCYIILGNTLDNAIEGALSTAEVDRKIHLQLRQHQGTLFYKLENSCTKSHTIRKRSKSHGYGLQNVNKCIEKYHGEMITSYANGIFTFTSQMSCGLCEMDRTF